MTEGKTERQKIHYDFNNHFSKFFSKSA